MPFDVFLKLDGMTGESTDAAHPNEIAVFSFSWGLDVPGSSTANTTGKPVFHDLRIVKHVDKASVALALAAAKQTPIPNGTLVCRKPGNTPFEFLQYRLKGVVVTGVEIGGATSGAEVVPNESVSFSCANVELSYTFQDASGRPVPSGRATFDIKGNVFS